MGKSVIYKRVWESHKIAKRYLFAVLAIFRLIFVVAHELDALCILRKMSIKIAQRNLSGLIDTVRLAAHVSNG